MEIKIIASIAVLVLLVTFLGIEKLRKWLLHWLFDLWAVFKPLRVQVLLLIVGVGAFATTDQAEDMFRAFYDDVDKGIYSYFSFYTAVLIIWSIVTWYSARLLLMMAEIPAEDRDKVEKLIEWLPRVLGAFPYFIATIAFSNVGGFYKWFFMLLGIAFIIVTWLWKRKSKAANRYALARIPWDQIGRFNRRLVRIAIPAFILAMIVFITPFGPSIAQGIGPAAIVGAALCSWTVAGMVLAYMDTRTPLPLFTFVLLLVLIFGITNNNHTIRTIEHSEKSYKENDRPLLSEHFRNWVMKKVDTSSRGEVPVYIVATQGGGIRAMNWTASVFEHLNRHVNGFHDHLFAVSGVSGGSVGACMYNAWKRDGRNDLTQLKALLSCDGLSTVTSAMLFPDMVQRFFPIAINRWDRARWLEDTWSDEYARDGKLRTFDEPFLSLWEKDPYGLPSLFLNSTIVESGQKSVLSNVRLDSAFFIDVVDLHKVIGKHVPLKTAALSSARFPYITPAGTVNSADTVFGNIVDGGYVENTGLGTAVQIMNLILDEIKNNPDPRFKKLKPVMIFIKNGNTEYDPFKPTAWMQEVSSPPKAFINAWGRSGVSTADAVGKTMNNIGLEYLTFELDRKDTTLPLGWFLSKTASDNMERQALRISVPNTINYASFDSIRKWEGGTVTTSPGMPCTMCGRK